MRFFKDENGKPLHKKDNLGIMKARVEYANDPKKMGRVRIRIPSLHGIKGKTIQFLEHDVLPWASPAFIGGCGEDFGFFTPPLPGTWVYVFFEDNDENKPVYFASAPGEGPKVPKKMANFGEEDSPLQEWFSKVKTPEVPEDAFDGKSTGVPERAVFKSHKGHTIIFDDSDDDESLSLIDRLGQIIKFVCPTPKDENIGGKLRRHLASALKGNQLGKSSDPYIIIQTGPSEDLNMRVFYEIHRDRVKIHSENLDSGKKTTTGFNPEWFKQQTQTSFIEMTEEFMEIDTKDVVSRKDADGYYVKYKEGQEVLLTKDEATLRFSSGKEAKFSEDSGVVSFNDTKIILNDEELIGVASKKIQFSVGDAVIRLEEGKVYLDGEEVHLNQTSDGEEEDNEV